MFNQFHRKIIITGRYVKKYYPNIGELEVAVQVRNILQPYSFVPKLFNADFENKSLEEEKVIFNKTSQELKILEVKLVAETLKLLHGIEIPSSLISSLTDEYTKDGNYHPERVFLDIFHNLPVNVRRKYKRYKKIAEDLEQMFLKSKPALSLIHANISPENLLFLESGLKIIDWDDTRIDLPLIDVYNFFRTFKISAKLQDIFWNAYGKPFYWTKSLDSLLKILQEMYDLSSENISVIIPTYNRCPYKKLNLNPLYTTVSTLLDGDNSNLIKNIIIGDDCSTDFTTQTWENLKNKYKSINFMYFRNKTRLKASGTRQEAIKICPSQLFLMTDDDCIFPKSFIENVYQNFKIIRQKDRDIAILNIPFANKRFKFNGTVPIMQFGRVDLKNHWVYHNFDKLPENIHEKYAKVDTFDGIFLGVKEKIQSVGGYEDLKDFIIDYAEHISLSWRLSEKGHSIYSALDKGILVTHLKYGDQDPNLKFEQIPCEYREILKKANIPFEGSGDRAHWLKNLESLIASFTYFYFCLSEKQGLEHIKKEYKYLVRDFRINKETLKAYKQGALTAVKIAKEKHIIHNEQAYIELLDQICKIRPPFA